MTPNNTSRKQWIGEIFDVFSDRTRPDQVWIEDSYEARDIARSFVPVEPRDFTFEYLASNAKLYPYGTWIFLFTVEAFHYYLPSLMALCIEDFKRADGIPNVLLNRINRFPPFLASIDKWAEEAIKLPLDVSHKDSRNQLYHDFDITKLKNWFFDEVEPKSIERISRLNDEERKVVVSFIDYLESTKEFRLFETTSARAMILNGSLANRLGASSEEEIVVLLQVIDLLIQKFPHHFIGNPADYVKAELEIERSMI